MTSFSDELSYIFDYRLRWQNAMMALSPFTYDAQPSSHRLRTIKRQSDSAERQRAGQIWIKTGVTHSQAENENGRCCEEIVRSSRGHHLT